MNRNEKMKGKDYIASGILSLMNMVGMLIASVMNISGYPEVDEFITRHKEFERMYGKGGFNNSLRQLKELLSE